MQRPKITKLLGEADRQFIITSFENSSEKLTQVQSLQVVKEDPDDDKFISCAVAAGAKVIISGDEHLLKLKQFAGIKIMSPKEFLDTNQFS